MALRIMKKTLFAIISFFVVTTLVGFFAQAGQVDLRDRLWGKAVQRANLQTVLRPFLVDRKVQMRLEQWLSHEKTRSFIVDQYSSGGKRLSRCETAIKSFVPSSKLVGPLCYFLYQAAFHPDASFRNESKEKFALMIQYWVEQQILALKEISEDPKYQEIEIPQSESLAERALVQYELLRNWADTHLGEMNHCFKEEWVDQGLTQKSVENFFFFYPDCYSKSKMPKGNWRATYNQSVRAAAAADLRKEFKGYPGHPISQTGWVGGNEVSYLLTNRYDQKTREVLEKSQKQIQWSTQYSVQPGGKGTVEKMQEQILKGGWQSVFAGPGFFQSSLSSTGGLVTDHPLWQGTAEETSIFQEITTALSMAEKTVFIDVFFLGGTMGVVIAKHLFALMEVKPELRVVVLKDMVNHFGLKDEMLPVMNYIKAYSLLHPGRLIFAPSYFKDHVPGIPQFVADVISDHVLEGIGLQEHLSLYGKGMSDHSKVIVIDAYSGSSNPVAFVGSKNLTDASGAICYDEVSKVSGPAALVIQDNYYEDMVAGMYHHLTDAELDAYQQRTPLMASQIGKLKVPDPKKSTEVKKSLARYQQIAEILKNTQGQEESFDLLNRRWTMTFGKPTSKPTQTEPVLAPEQGEVQIRVGENNFDSTITSVLDQLIHNILWSEKKIRVSDQFMFDENVNFALQDRQEELKGALDVKMILEPTTRDSDSRALNFPNQIYIDELTREVANRPLSEIRWKRMLQGESGIHQEYHMKTMSFDDRVLISGSANKDRNTLYGSFRETQLEIFDSRPDGAVARHDQRFDHFWSTPQETYPDLPAVIEPYQFDVPKEFSDLFPLDLSDPQTRDTLAKLFIYHSRLIMDVLYSAQDRFMAR